MKYLLLFCMALSGCSDVNSHRQLYNKVTIGCTTGCKPDNFKGKIQVHPEYIGCICE